jgi:hypothetical protein
MRGSRAEIGDYVSRVALLLERSGVALHLPEDGQLEASEWARDGSLGFELVGELAADRSQTSRIRVRERFEHIGPDDYERVGYEYELLDRELDLRRAFHLHDADWFARTFMVVVHEHCEHPIGQVTCPHYVGSPLKDAFAGVMALMAAWAEGRADCSGLRCLE